MLTREMWLTCFSARLRFFWMHSDEFVTVSQ